MPIAVVAKTFGIVALRKDFSAKTVQEFVAYAKSNPGKINLGHAGVGSSNFLICKSFVQAAGIDVTLVGYRGAAPALTDAIGGQIDGVCDAAASVSQAIDDRLVKGLVVGSTVRWRRCRICRPRPKPAFPNSRHRAGTACLRRRGRRLRSSPS
jgi:tripartite-type tricarboxylate transporter receptor subunit TctC